MCDVEMDQLPSRGFASLSPREYTNLVGKIPIEIRSLIQLQEQHLIQFIGTPFSESEMTWLLNTRRIISITHFFSTGDGKTRNWITSANGARAKVSVANNRHNHVSFGYEMDVFESNPNLARNIAREVAPTFQPPTTTPWKISLLDLKSLFMLLKHRLEIGASSIQCKEYVLRYLDDILSFFARDLVAIELYLYTTAMNIELEVPPMMQQGGDYRQLAKGIAERCMIYRNTIVSALGCMC